MQPFFISAHLVRRDGVPSRDFERRAPKNLDGGAEVDEGWRSVRTHHDVVRLDVAVKQASPVQVSKPAAVEP
jgi:hypothetical protein